MEKSGEAAATNCLGLPYRYNRAIWWWCRRVVPLNNLPVKVRIKFNVFKSCVPVDLAKPSQHSSNEINRLTRPGKKCRKPDFLSEEHMQTLKKHRISSQTLHACNRKEEKEKRKLSIKATPERPTRTIVSTTTTTNNNRE